jgi:hypothetical protein
MQPKAQRTGWSAARKPDATKTPAAHHPKPPFGEPSTNSRAPTAVWGQIEAPVLPEIVSVWDGVRRATCILHGTCGVFLALGALGGLAHSPGAAHWGHKRTRSCARRRARNEQSNQTDGERALPPRRGGTCLGAGTGRVVPEAAQPGRRVATSSLRIPEAAAARRAHNSTARHRRPSPTPAVAHTHPFPAHSNLSRTVQHALSRALQGTNVFSHCWPALPESYSEWSFEFNHPCC